MKNEIRRQIRMPKSQENAQSIRPMEEFGRYAAQRIHQLVEPLEILTHTIYLANRSLDDPPRLREYLAAAEEQARIIASAKRELLDRSQPRSLTERLTPLSHASLHAQCFGSALPEPAAANVAKVSQARRATHKSTP